MGAPPRDILDDLAVDLEALAAERAPGYAAGKPFPHGCFDGVFSDELLRSAASEFPSGYDWKDAKLPDKSPKKKIATSYDELGPYTKHLFNLLTSSPFVRFVEEVTGVPRLIPDPHLHNGGLHEYTTGGALELHTDYNYSPGLRLYRRINLLLYLNTGWEDDWGGDLQLWDRNLTTSVSFPPRFNRMVLAQVLPDGLHGVGEIKCPEGETRKSVALWYYTSQLPLDLQTEYDLCEPDFIERPGGKMAPLPRPLWRQLVPPILTARLKRKKQCFTYSPHLARSTATRFVPPVLMRALYAMRNGRSS